MNLKEKNITFQVSEDEYLQLLNLAKNSQLSLSEFVKSLVLLFTDNKSPLSNLNSEETKDFFENDLQKMAKQLEKKRSFVDLLIRSIYSTQLRLEGQFKKLRKEAEKELKKDIERITMMMESSANS